MKNLFLFAVLLVAGSSAWGQSCAEKWEKVFNQRKAFPVQNEMHRNVVIYLEENGDAGCYRGKVRVENECVTVMLVQLENDEYIQIDGEFTNYAGNRVKVENGMSEWMKTKDGRKARVFFIENIKPKAPEKQEADDPDEFLKSL